MDNELIVFSMCNGSQSRWDGPGIKQLTRINGEPILTRQVNQVSTWTHMTWVVTHEQIIINHIANSRGVVLKVPQEGENLLWSMMWTFEWWKPRTIFLLGDVYYTDDVLNAIFECRDDLMFFGNNEELFALTVVQSAQRKLRNDMAFISSNSRGKLWNLFYWMNGWDYRKGNRPKTRQSKLLYFTEDLTDDVDKMRFKRRLLRRLREAQYD